MVFPMVFLWHRKKGVPTQDLYAASWLDCAKLSLWQPSSLGLVFPKFRLIPGNLNQGPTRALNYDSCKSHSFQGGLPFASCFVCESVVSAQELPEKSIVKPDSRLAMR